MIETIANFLIAISGFGPREPDELEINQNITTLRKLSWFNTIYLENEPLFLKDADIRYVIGRTKVKKVLKNAK